LRRPPAGPVFVLVILRCTLAGFAGVNLTWAAGQARWYLTPATSPGTEPGPDLACLRRSVPGVRPTLGIAVAAVARNGLAAALARLVPAGTSLPATRGPGRRTGQWRRSLTRIADLAQLT
jgi:arsenical pump membrane protein